MALIEFPSAQGHIPLVLNLLSEFTATSFPLAEKIVCAAKEQELSISFPHEIFAIDPRYGSPSNYLPYAERVGFRVLLLHQEEILATAEFRLPDDGEPSFSNIYEGPTLNNLFDLIRNIEETPQIISKDYYFRRITVPGLYLDTVWLAPVDRSGEDLLIPIMDGTTMLNEFVPYGQSAYFDSFISKNIQSAPQVPDPCPPIVRIEDKDENE